MAWLRSEHAVIADALAAMDGAWLLNQHCYFGGGTAIVMRHGEYRRSLDIDFLCADQEGYRGLREAARQGGIAAFFGPSAETIREIRSDQYGIRAIFAWNGQAIRFEIIREARIGLAGAIDERLGVPVLAEVDQAVETLLANADRWADAAVHCRDAFDLGMLLLHQPALLPGARDKAEAAYGADIARSLLAVTEHLASPVRRDAAAIALQMERSCAIRAVAAMRAAATSAWPALVWPVIKHAD